MCNSGQCILESWVCDGAPDCELGEDELNCHTIHNCEEDRQFQCKRSVGCIPTELLCNGHKDCADG